MSVSLSIEEMAARAGRLDPTFQQVNSERAAERLYLGPPVDDVEVEARDIQDRIEGRKPKIKNMPPEKLVEAYPNTYQRFLHQAILQPTASLMAGFQTGAKNFTKMISLNAELVGYTSLAQAGYLGDTILPISEFFGNVSKRYGRSEQYYKNRGITPGNGFASDLALAMYEGIGEFGVDITAITAMGLPAFSAVMGSSGAYESGDNPLIGGATGFAQGLFFGKAFEAAGKLGPVAGRAAGSAVFAGPSLFTQVILDPHGIEPSRAIADALIGAALPRPRRGQAKEISDINKRPFITVLSESFAKRKAPDIKDPLRNVEITQKFLDSLPYENAGGKQVRVLRRTKNEKTENKKIVVEDLATGNVQTMPEKAFDRYYKPIKTSVDEPSPLVGLAAREEVYGGVFPDLSSRPELLDATAKLEKSVFRTDKQKRQSLKNRFGLVDKEGLDNGDLVEYQQMMAVMQKPNKFKTGDILRLSSSGAIRRKMPRDHITEDKYEQSIMSRWRNTQIFLAEKKHKRKINRLFPRNDTVADLQDAFLFSANRENINVANESNILKQRAIEDFSAVIRNNTDIKDPVPLKTPENAEAILRYVDSGKTNFTPTKAIKNRQTMDAVVDAVQQSDIANRGRYVASRLQESFISGNKKYVPPDLSKADYADLHQIYRGLHTRLPFKEATDRFVEEVTNRTNEKRFGVQEFYRPTQHDVSLENFVNFAAGPKGAGKPTAQYNIGQSKTLAPERFWSWFDRKEYRENINLYGSPGMVSFLERAKQLYPDNPRRMESVVRSFYGVTEPAGLLESAATKISSLVYKAWQFANMFAVVRNLAQNLAKSVQLPIKQMFLGLKDMKRYTDEQAEHFETHIKQRKPMEETLFLNVALFGESNIGRFVDKAIQIGVSPYGMSDTANRSIVNHGLLPLEMRLVKPYLAGKISTEKLFQELKIEQLPDVTKSHLLTTLKREPERFLEEYATQKINDVHHRYTLLEKPISFQSPAGRILSGLLVFPIGELGQTIRNAKIASQFDTPAFGKRQAAAVVANTLADISVAGIASAASLYTWHSIAKEVGRHIGMSEEEKAKNEIVFRKAYGDKLQSTLSWVFPSLIANNIIQKMTGRRGTYGVKQLAVGDPLTSSVITSLDEGVITPMLQWAQNPSDENLLIRAAQSVADQALELVPGADMVLNILAYNHDMINISIAKDLIPYWIKSEDGESMAAWRIRFAQEVGRRIQFVNSENMTPMEKYVHAAHKTVMGGGEKSGIYIKRKVTRHLVNASAMADLAEDLLDMQEYTLADQFKQLADWHWQEYEKARIFAPQSAAKMEYPYESSKSAIKRIKAKEEIKALKRIGQKPFEDQP